jgi:hypothetical protein
MVTVSQGVLPIRLFLDTNLLNRKIRWWSLPQTIQGGVMKRIFCHNHKCACTRVRRGAGLVLLGARSNNDIKRVIHEASN